MTTKHKKAVAILRGGADEPIINEASYRIDLMKAFNYYNTEDVKIVRKYADQYLTTLKRKDAMYGVSKAFDYEMKQIGVIGRLVARGQYVSVEDIERVSNRIDELKDKYKKEQSVVEDTTVVRAVPVSIQERITEAARNHAGEIDNAIDTFVTTKSSEFSAKSYLLSNEISGAVSKRIGDFYQPLVRELEEAVRGKDEQLNEGYSHFTTSELKKFVGFVKGIVADCTQQAVSARSQRKPRARKVKPASVIVAKMKYLKEYADLKLKSINPAEIIGSDELWTYNPTTRKLTVFRGSDGPLGVSGMSITNYDVSKSETKTLRKPEEFFKGLASTGKRAMANAWKSVRAKVSKPRARINEEMILLAAN